MSRGRKKTLHARRTRVVVDGWQWWATESMSRKGTKRALGSFRAIQEAGAASGSWSGPQPSNTEVSCDPIAKVPDARSSSPRARVCLCVFFSALYTVIIPVRIEFLSTLIFHPFFSENLACSLGSHHDQSQIIELYIRGKEWVSLSLVIDCFLVIFGMSR